MTTYWLLGKRLTLHLKPLGQRRNPVAQTRCGRKNPVQHMVEATDPPESIVCRQCKRAEV